MEFSHKLKINKNSDQVEKKNHKMYQLGAYQLLIEGHDKNGVLRPDLSGTMCMCSVELKIRYSSYIRSNPLVPILAYLLLIAKTGLTKTESV